ncbi:hypothetical protein [Micromonospora globbae]|uniref:Uncharacterized protein n=1 Tax=Micromonospora globbae TaxID=1894969 RepID=A0A420EVE0_9ACTN|nr:hypothetical protein [Micromonospora globbae]RKF24653.1 hypothetical protein D7I43_25070 [Micromonospora globbae]
MRPSSRRTVAAFIAALALTGCGSSGTPAPGDKASASVSPTARPSYDPPTRFEPAAPVPLPAELTSGVEVLGRRAVLHDTTLFAATATGLLAVDALTGTVRATISPENKVADDVAHRDLAGPPVLADVAGQPTTLAAFPVSIPGQGTTPARTAIELTAVSAVDASRLPAIVVDVPADATGPTAVVGTAGSVVVVRAGTTTYGINLTSKTLAWNKVNFTATTVAGDVAVGSLAVDSAGIKLRTAGVGATDGNQRWTDPQDSTEVRVQPAGPKHVLVTGRDYGNGRAYYRLVASATGAAVESGQSSGPASYQLTCHYDQTSTTVCAADNWTGGYDAQTGKLLWELPDTAANRTAVKVTTAWHGAVYGTTDNGPLVLDARTGADRQPTPGAAPYLVSGYVGIATNPSSQGTAAFTAIG